MALRPANWVQTNDLGQWFVDMGNSGQRSTRDGLWSMIMLTVWEIWKERNNRVFNKITRTAEQVFSAIQDEAKVWIRAGNKGLEEVLPSTAQIFGVGPLAP